MANDDSHINGGCRRLILPQRWIMLWTGSPNTSQAFWAGHLNSAWGYRQPSWSRQSHEEVCWILCCIIKSCRTFPNQARILFFNGTREYVGERQEEVEGEVANFFRYYWPIFSGQSFSTPASSAAVSYISLFYILVLHCLLEPPLHQPSLLYPWSHLNWGSRNKSEFRTVMVDKWHVLSIFCLKLTIPDILETEHHNATEG